MSDSVKSTTPKNTPNPAPDGNLVTPENVPNSTLKSAPAISKNPDASPLTTTPSQVTTPATPVRVEKLVPGGQGIGTLATGQKIFFWNALPGELVTSYQLIRKKSRHLEAIAFTIAESSPRRIAPVDNSFLSTSPWQILDYPTELEQKALVLIEAFRQQHIDLADFTTPSHPLLPVTDHHFFHYRNKMEYALYWDNSDQRIYPAFCRRNTHRKIPILASSLERPEIFQRAKEIIADLNARGEEARKYQSLMLRASQDGRVSGGLLEKFQPHPTFPPLTDTLLGHPYTYAVTGFFQINVPLYELALTDIARFIQTEKVLDLYAGVGTIGLSVARDRELTLVEVNPAAYAELENNCASVMGAAPVSAPSQENTPSPNYSTLSEKSQALTSAPAQITPILAKSESALQEITPDRTVILDPPRSGCDPQLIARLLAQTPPTIIYLSCNPATQARDVKPLLEKYQLTHFQPYNFFPRTPHIENLIVLTRR